MGLVLGARRNSGRPSPLETALFALADVEDVEAEDFGVDETPRLQSCDVPKKASRPDQKLNQEIEGGACEVFRAMENLDASELTITFVGDKSDGLGANNMLEITARKETRRIALAALALVDRRGGSANSQGVILLGMALKKKLTYTGANAAKMKRLRDMFRSHLGISGDPFEPYHQGAGWVPRFMIADKRGAADERARREAERRTDSYEQLNERGDRFADSSPTDRLLDADDADDWLKDNDPDAAA